VQDQDGEDCGEEEEEKVDQFNVCADNTVKKIPAANEDIDDLQLAWENLELANKICQRELQSGNLSEAAEREAKLSLARINLRLGELEQWRENLSEAITDFEQALTLRAQVEDLELSREASELYFLLGNTLLYDHKENCESNAIRYFLRSKEVLENILFKTQQGPKPPALQTETLQLSQLDRSHLEELEGDSVQEKELKGVIANLYDKLEDTVSQRLEKDEVDRELKQMRQAT